MESSISPSPLVQLLPLLIVTIIYGGVAIAIGRRKVENLILWTVLCLIPIVNMFALIFLISKTDLRVLKELDELRARLDRLDAAK
jgi:hypothetical protein